MSRIKNGYNSFRIKDLAGGINLENSPNEIENKECLEATNFDFEGNKVVSGKKASNLYTISSPIIAEGVIDGSLYYVSGGKLYKDGVEQITRSFAHLFDQIPTAGTTYGITINGTAYNYTASVGDVADAFPEGIIMQEIYDLIPNTFSKQLSFVEKNGVAYYSILLFGANITSDSNTNLNREVSDELDLLSGTDGFILGNLGDLIIIRGLASFLQKIKDQNGNVAYFAQEILNVGSLKYGCTYEGKLIGASGDDAKLVFSKASDGDEFYNVKIFDKYDAGEQIIGGESKITGIVTGEEGIYVFKTDEVYYSNSVQDDGINFAFVFKKITNNGAESQKAITKVGQEIFYFDGINKQLRRLSYEQNLTTLRDTGVSTKIKPIIDSYSSITLGYSYPNVSIIHPTLSSIEYNVDVKSFHINSENKGKAVGNFIYNNTNIKKLLGEYNTSGAFISKEYDLGDGIDFKRFAEIELYGTKAATSDLFLDVYEDGVVVQTFEIENNYTSDTFKLRFDLWNEGRFFKFGLRYEGAGKIEINEVNIMYKTLRNNFQNYIG